MYSLCFDFGNTRQKCAVFNNNVLQEVIVLSSTDEAGVAKIVEQYKPAKSILSSVIHHPTAINDYLEKHSYLHVLNYQSKLPITIPVGKPETIGADRLAICAAATLLYPKTHCLAIGLGTCITFNFINKFGEFLGGSISPGMNMRFKAMNDYTALLPIVPAQHHFPLIGYDTKTNLQSGVLLGMAKEIEGIIELYQEKYDNLKVAITGGDASFFIHHINKKIDYEEHLIFKGLLAIGNENWD
jgi:type III pantothenate kinase